jgi:hypothetical protein
MAKGTSVGIEASYHSGQREKVNSRSAIEKRPEGDTQVRTAKPETRLAFRRRKIDWKLSAFHAVAAVGQRVSWHCCLSGNPIFCFHLNVAGQKCRR